MISDFFEKLKRNFALNSSVTILNNKQVLIENCKNIVECNDILVRIISSNYEIEVWGVNLKISNYSSKTIAVNGEIQSVNVVKRGKNN
ncbi:MAG: hypothetical protein GX896_08555 [Clostridiales bacterium]|nr:hypothetical protein [Clostridiales bacterium]